MANWFKQQLANVAGTQEPIYGPSAIRSVASQPTTNGWTELTKDQLKWRTIDQTCVETQTFYITADNGLNALAQVIYSNIIGIRTSTQFSAKIFFNDGTEHLWGTDKLENWKFDDEKFSLTADKCTLTLSEDGNSYTMESTSNKDIAVSLKFTKVAPGFVAGVNGTTDFGTNPEKPWGSVRHAFWPRCKVDGIFKTSTAGDIDMKGTGLFIHALQGMKPHHAAETWNFVNFQSPTYSAIMMDYVTPPSYGTTLVNVGCVAVDGKVLFAGCNNEATHTEIKDDPEARWPEPVAVSYQWNGKSEDGNTMKADLTGPLGTRTDRVDVMAEVPQLVKRIVSGSMGMRPYIYQYVVPELSLKVTTNGNTVEEKGRLFAEATFITEDDRGKK